MEELKCKNLSDVEDDVGVLVGLEGVHGLSVVPEQISGSRTIVRKSQDQVQGLTGADPQSQVWRLFPQKQRNISKNLKKA